jgi:hypothetical protein
MNKKTAMLMIKEHLELTLSNIENIEFENRIDYLKYAIEESIVALGTWTDKK